MNGMMMEEAARRMPHAMRNPVAQGDMMAATGFAAGRGPLGAALLRNPLVLLAGGTAAGYLLRKYEKETVFALSKAAGMGKDCVLHQKENLDDPTAEAHETEAAAGDAPAAPAAGPRPGRRAQRCRERHDALLHDHGLPDDDGASATRGDAADARLRRRHAAVHAVRIGAVRQARPAAARPAAEGGGAVRGRAGDLDPVVRRSVLPGDAFPGGMKPASIGRRTGTFAATNIAAHTNASRRLRCNAATC